MSMDLIQIINQTIIDAADLGASQTSTVLEGRNARRYGIQIYWSGGTSTAGDVIVEGTNDDPALVPSPTYTAISTDAVAATSGSLMKRDFLDFSYVRVRWVRSAGSGGTITSKASIKR